MTEPVRWWPDEAGDAAGRYLDVADVDGDGCAEIAVSTDWSFGYGYDGDAGAFVLRTPWRSGELHRRASTEYVSTDWALDYWGQAVRFLPATRSVVFWGLADGPPNYRILVMPADAGTYTEQDLLGGFDVPGFVRGAECRSDGGPALCVAAIQLPELDDPLDYDFRGWIGGYDLPLTGLVRWRSAAFAVWGDPGDRAEVVYGRSDFDGDGATDLLVGAFERGGAGAVAWVREPPAGSHRVWDVADATFTAAAPIDNFGGHLGGGDLDGDGVDDVVIGGNFGADGGRLSVFRGPPSGHRTAADADWTVLAPGPGAWLGVSSAVGDFDGDGRADLAVGAPRSIYTATEPGEVYVFLHPPPGELRREDADRVLVSGVSEPDGFGVTLGSGFLDGDERADLVIGAPRDPAGLGYGAGSVTLWTGAALFP